MVIKFALVYPSYHPRAGEPTEFVEKMIQWYWNTQDHKYHNVFEMLKELNGDKFKDEFYQQFNDKLNPKVQSWKSHTIRENENFKAGDWFTPYAWTGKPYRSLQIQFLPELVIQKTWDIKTFPDTGKGFCAFSETIDRDVNIVIEWETIKEIATNDGLTIEDFIAWFNKPLEGQIICWNKKINY